MTRTFIDVNIPMYAAGAPHPLRESSQRVIMAIATGQLDAVTDTEVFQEILYRYIHIGEREKGFRVFDHFYRIMAGRILPIDEADLQQARNLAERYATLSTRDVIHLGVMRHHQLRDIITADTGFDAIEAIRRLDPRLFLPES